MTTLDTLQDQLGYRFQTLALMKQAVTHRSFGTPNNERLEFLGDAMLNAYIAEALYRRHPEMPEGDLSRLRSNLVNQSALAEIATCLALGDVLRLGEGEVKTGGSARPSILADALESIIGAVFLDGGSRAAAEVVARLFAELLDGPRVATASKDAKTALQEWLQGRRLALPKYVVAQITGAAHQQQFRVNCIIEKPSLSESGLGTTRRAAEQDAASRALARLTGSESAPAPISSSNAASSTPPAAKKEKA